MNFVYPPRPAGLIDPANLPLYERSGKWEAQWKYNGTRTVILIKPDRSIMLYQRQGTPHKQYKISVAMQESLLGLELIDGHGYILDGELLHSKTTTVKDTIVLYDVLYAEKYLYMTSYGYRRNLLTGICRNPQALEPRKGLALQITKNLWLAPTFTEGLPIRFKECMGFDQDEREGLVLKRPDGVLNNLGAREYEVDWQVRCRKPHAGGNYRR